MTPEVRAQLERLRISKDQRPEPVAASAVQAPRRGRTLFIILLLAAGAAYLLYSRGLLDRFGGRALVERVSQTFDSATAAPPPPPPPVAASQVASSQPRAAVTATGKIVSDHLVNVSTKVSGQIVALYFEQGDFVRKGQVLARIEEVNYRARRDEARANLEKSRANLEYQSIDFARVEALFKTGDAPAIEHARVRRSLDEARAQMAADEAALESSQKTLSDCEVVAPIAGVILTRQVEVGDFVAAEGGRGANANAQFATIADMSKLRVEVDISEMDIHRIRTDMPCRIVPDAYKDRTFEGRVMWLDPGANYSKATVQVKVRIESPDPKILRVEGSAKVIFLADPPGAENGDGRGA